MESLQASVDKLSGELDGVNLLLAEERESNAQLRRRLEAAEQAASKLDHALAVANMRLIAKDDLLRTYERANTYEIDMARIAREERKAWRSETMKLRKLVAALLEYQPADIAAKLGELADSVRAS